MITLLKKKSIYCFGYISCFSEEPRFVLSFSSYTGLHILLYSWLCPFFSKFFFLKSSNVLCCREDTQKNPLWIFFSSDLYTKPVMELSTVLQRILWAPARHLFCIWVEEKTRTRKLHEGGMETSGSLANYYVLKYVHLVHCRQAVSSNQQTSGEVHQPSRSWQHLK